MDEQLARLLMDPARRGLLLALIDDINPTTGQFALDELPCYVGGVDINSLITEDRAAHEAQVARKQGARGRSGRIPVPTVEEG